MKKLLWVDSGTVENDYEDRAWGAVVKVYCEAHGIFVHFYVRNASAYFAPEGQRIKIIVQED